MKNAIERKLIKITFSCVIGYGVLFAMKLERELHKQIDIKFAK